MLHRNTLRICRTLLAALVILVGLLTAVSPVVAAGTGTIAPLTASSGNPSTVSATLTAGSKKVNNSNVTFQIFDSNSILVGSYGPVSISLAALQSTVVTWSWPVNGTGPFSVTACWSPGGSGNCKIDNKTTNFTAVSSLGPVLPFVAIALIGLWFWRARKQLVRKTPTPSGLNALVKS